jgi:N-acetylglutamate synthase-like GNAT family acetyltransferase
MDEFDRRYVSMLNERDYPTPVPEVTPAKAEAPPKAEPLPGQLAGMVRMQGRAEAARHQAAQPPAEKPSQYPPVTVGDIGLTVMDTLASLLKGATASTLGLPGDIESLVRLLTGGEQRLATTEDMTAKLPPVVPEGSDPRRKETEEGASKVGELFGVSPAPVKISKGAIKAVKAAVGSEKAIETTTELSKRLSTQFGARVTVEDAGAQLKIAGMGLDEAKQGQGTGTKIIEEIKAYADQSGKNVVLTATPRSADKQAALNRFYERNGFVRFGEDPLNHQPYYGYKAHRSAQ